MSNVVQLPTRETVEPQAAQWIARLDRGLTAAEERELQAWLQVSDANRTALLAMAELWDKMDDLARLASLFERPAQATAQRRLARSPYAVAASCAAIVFALFMGVLLGVNQPNENVMVQQYYQTSIGEQTVIELPDNSKLRLNTNTLVKVDYQAARRLLVLERGEIHIDVAHDKSRPLSVVVQDKIIEAVGTAFNVRVASAQEVEVIVTDGEVRVGHGLPQGSHVAAAEAFAEQAVAAQALSRGERLVLGTTKHAVQKVPEDDLNAQLSWRDGNLIFRGETLSEALDEISRYTPISFRIADEEIRQVRIAGLFKAGDVDGLLNALEQNFHISHRRDANVIVLTKFGRTET